MDDVYLSFRGTGREGAMAAGNYLIDAAHQLGVNLNCDCSDDEPTNSCAVKVIKGTALLSAKTEKEVAQLSASERKGKQRLACQVKIEKPGEIEVEVVHVTDDIPKDDKKPIAEAYKEAFAELPLDQKIKELVELEGMTFGDTVSYIMNSPYEAVGGVMSVLARFGRKMEDDEREAKVPPDHAQANGAAGASDVQDDSEIPAEERQTATDSDE